LSRHEGTACNLPYFANSPAIKTMDSAINKYEPGTLENVNDNELAVEGWMAGEPFQAAVAAGHLGVGGAPTAAEVMKGLDSLHGETLDGPAPPLTFTAGKPHRVDYWYYAVLKDGAFTTPYGLSNHADPWAQTFKSAE
jgi:branched-chain amino acid transport system substrate-binding protein